jgi:hypothetical protein
MEYFYTFVRIDLFIVQTLYDPWVARNILGITCTGDIGGCSEADRAVLETHRVNTLRQIALIASRYYSSAFVLACSHHTVEIDHFRDQKYVIYGETLQQAVSRFVARKFTNGYFDTQAWPSNQGCAKLTQLTPLANLRSA